MQAQVLKTFETMLLTRRSELQTIILSNEQILREQLSPEETGDNAFDINHPADMISADPDYDKQIELIRRERAELEMVSAALLRIELGNYGRCESCHQDIPFERLQAIPYTRYCIECKEDKDLEAQRDQRPNSGAKPHDLGNIGL